MTKPRFSLRLIAQGWLCGLIIGALALLAQPVRAAEIIVNSAIMDRNPGDGQCSLLEAVRAAETNADTAEGDCVAGDEGADRIRFATDLLPLTLDSDATSVIVNIREDSGLVIDGQGEVRIDGAGTLNEFFFYVGGAADGTTLRGLTFANLENGAGSAVILLDASEDALSDLTIQDNTFTDINRPAVRAAVTDFAYENLTILSNTFANIEDTALGALHNLRDSLIADNRFEAVNIGLDLRDDVKVSVIGNDIREARSAAVQIGGIAPATTSADLTIAHNNLIDGDETALRLQGDYQGETRLVCNAINNNAQGLVTTGLTGAGAPLTLLARYNDWRNAEDASLSIASGTVGELDVADNLGLNIESISDPDDLLAGLDADPLNAADFEEACRTEPNLNKVYTPSSITTAASTLLEYTITRPVGLAPAVPLPGLNFVDVLPAGLSIGTLNNGCGGTISNPQGTIIQLEDGILPASGTCDITARLTGPVGNYGDAETDTVSVLPNTGIIGTRPTPNNALLVIAPARREAPETSAAEIIPPPVDVPATVPITGGALTIQTDVNPPFGQPGDIVTFSFNIGNPGNEPSTNIVASSTVPGEFDILEAEAPFGRVAVNEQVVSFTGSLNPGQAVTVTIATRVRGSTATPFVLTNQACINVPNQNCDQAAVTSVTALPATGVTPPWVERLRELVEARDGDMTNLTLSELEDLGLRLEDLARLGITINDLRDFGIRID